MFAMQLAVVAGIGLPADSRAMNSIFDTDDPRVQIPGGETPVSSDKASDNDARQRQTRYDALGRRNSSGLR